MGMRVWGIAALLVCTIPVCAADLHDALAAMGRGDFAAAERVLRAEVAAHPDDAPALSLLGAALDSQHKIAEAGPFHQRALAAAPRSVDVLGNYGNHLLAADDDEGARRAFEKAAAIDPGNAGANLQLARLALKHSDGAGAVRYLKHVPDAALADPRLSFSLAVGLANAREFAAAEGFFTRALAADPADFNILYNLGAVAAAAGHYERACEVLQAALRQQPENVDVLYRLADTEHALRRNDAALALLARASKLQPERADVQKLLALAAADVGALPDALAAWDRYLKLAPDDDAARRERAFIAMRVGRTAEGLAELRSYLEHHPGDATGHFELGLAQSREDPAAALAELDKAVSLRPDFAAARAARGNLYYQQGKPEAALPDLEVAAKAEPGDAPTLDRLGQTYLALDRTADAVRVLRRAAELAPADSTVQLHFGRALAQAGDTAESKKVMERFRQLGPATKRGVPAGLVDYLALTPEQRRADYRARVEKAVREHPDDAAAQLDYLNLLLDDGRIEDASATAAKLAALHPAPSARLAIANARLLEVTGKPGQALATLDQALAGAPANPGLCWRHTALLVRLKRAPDALAALERAGQGDEILLLKAVVLELSGRDSDGRALLDEMEKRRPEWAALRTIRKLEAKTGGISELGELLQQKPPEEW